MSKGAVKCKQTSWTGKDDLPIDVNVRLVCGRTLTIPLHGSCQVQEIYNRIAREEDVEMERVLIKYTGKKLNPNQTIGYTGIRPETLLKVEIVTVREYSITVKHTDGRMFPMQLRNITLINAIKAFVESSFGIPPANQLLTLSGHVLADNSQTAMDAGIGDDDELFVAEKTSEASAAAGDIVTDLTEQDRNNIVSSFQAAGRAVDVVFSFDTTGSMYSCLDKVRSKLSGLVKQLIDRVPRIRVGIIAHGDYCDYSTYVLRSLDLTSDAESLSEFVKNVPQTSGGDCPECYEWVLRKAQLLDWSEDSAKALVVIGDCQPHPPSYTNLHINWHNELDVLKGMGIKVCGVRAQNSAEAEPFYRELAEQTGGAYIAFSNFDIISEMFLAVCYREASDEQYQQFCDDVTTKCDLTESAQSAICDVIKQLDEQTVTRLQDKPKRYKACDWWDPELDRTNGPPQYIYDSENDKWSPFSREGSFQYAGTAAETDMAVAAKRSLRSRLSVKLRRKSNRPGYTTDTGLPQTHKNRFTSCGIM